MKKPTKKKEPPRTTLRLPEELKAELKKAADYHGRSVNAEILSRLNAASLEDQFSKLSKENAELKAMIRELLEKL